MNTDILVKLNGFGLWSHSISEAAQLVALDMFYSGELENVCGGYDDLQFEPERDDDPRLVALLSREIERLSGIFVKAIELGRLECEHVQRDLEEHIILSETYVNHGALCEWLESRGYELGDVLNGWGHDGAELISYVLNEVVSLRKAQKEGKNVLRDILFNEVRTHGEKNESNFKNLYSSWKSSQEEIERLKSENERLKEELSCSKVEGEGPPLTQRRKRTYSTLIAALCIKAGISWEGRGAAQRIKEATEEIGAPVSDDTIKSILSDIPDALDSRMK